MHKKIKLCTVCSIFGRTALRRRISSESANPHFWSGIEKAKRKFRALRFEPRQPNKNHLGKRLFLSIILLRIRLVGIFHLALNLHILDDHWMYDSDYREVTYSGLFLLVKMNEIRETSWAGKSLKSWNWEKTWIIKSRSIQCIESSFYTTLRRFTLQKSTLLMTQDVLDQIEFQTSKQTLGPRFQMMTMNISKHPGYWNSVFKGGVFAGFPHSRINRLWHLRIFEDVTNGNPQCLGFFRSKPTRIGFENL